MSWAFPSTHGAQRVGGTRTTHSIRSTRELVRSMLQCALGPLLSIFGIWSLFCIVRIRRISQLTSCISLLVAGN